MHFERYGTGPHVFVGFHGWTGSHRTYAPLAPHLPSDVTLFAADLPGCGLSPVPDIWALEPIVNEVNRELDKVVPGAFTLIGNCSGAIMALLSAPSVIERINRLILIDPFAYMPWYFRIFLADPWGRHVYASTFANPVGRWMTNMALRSKRTAETDLTDSFATINHTVTYNYLKLFGSIQGIEQFGLLDKPIDIAYGEHTFGAIKASIPAWHRLWPHAEIWEMKGAGHLPIQEATGQVAGMIFNNEHQPVGRVPS